MQDLALYIGDNQDRVILSKDSTVAMSYAVHDINRMDSRNGGSSNEFEAPLDPNREALETLWDSQSGSYLPFKRIPARLEARGVEIPAESVEVTASGSTVSLRLYAGNSNLFEIIKGKKLTDLDLSAWDLPFENQLNWTGAGGPFCFMPIETGRTLGRPKADGWPDFTEEELTLCVSSKYLLQQIILQAGLTPEGSLYNYPDFLNEVIPATEGYIRFREGYTSLHGAIAKPLNDIILPYTPGGPNLLTVQLDIDMEVSDPGNHFIGGTYIASIQGDYKIKVTFVYDWNTTGPQYPLLRIRTDTGAILSQINLTQRGNSKQVVLTAEVQDYTGQFTAELFYSESDLITMKEATRMEFTLGDRTYRGQPLHIDANLPDMTQADFVKDVMNTYCVLVDTVHSGTVYTERMADAMLKEPVDWTDKVDLTDIPTTEYRLADYAQLNTLLYAEDADPGTEGFSVEPGDRKSGVQTWHQFGVANTNLKEERVAWTSNFAPTGLVKTFGNGIYLPYVPIVDVEGATIRLLLGGTDYEPGEIIFENGVHYHVDYGFFSNDAAIGPDSITTGGGLVVVAHRIPYHGNYKGCKPRKLYVREATQNVYASVDSGSDTPVLLSHEVTFEGLEWPTLYAKHYGPMANILSRVHLIKPRFRLTAPDVMDLPFRKPVYIGQIIYKGQTLFGGLYYLNTIEEYLPGTDLSCDGQVVNLNM